MSGASRTQPAIEADVVVVGAGTAGAGAALQFARRGRRVLVLEQRAADRGGARWDNGIIPWQFERAGLVPPAPPECAPAGGTTVMVGPDGTSFCVPHNPVLSTDMRQLTERLMDEARSYGTQVIDHIRDLTAEVRDGRVRAVNCSVDGRGALHIRAALFIDASGRSAALRHQVTTLDRWCPDVTPSGLCSAGQYSHDVADPSGAHEFLERHGAEPGDAVTFIGFAGGFSALSISVSSDLDEVGVLTGTLGQREWGTGPSLLTLTRARHRWIGPPRFGGAGLIPLRRPYARLTAPGLALVGDAACQVFPAHGSGIGISLVAGALLAEATAETEDLGGEQNLWRYQAAFHLEFGGTLGGYDVIRRLSSRLGTAGVSEMFRAGLVGPGSTLAGLRQTWWTPPPSELPRLAAALAVRPGLAARVLPALARSSLAHHVYERYPQTADLGALRRWERWSDSLLGAAAI